MELQEKLTNPAFQGDTNEDKNSISSHKPATAPRDPSDGKVAVVGSGDMCLALVTAMAKGGVASVIGSRNPDRARSRLKGLVEVEVTSVEEAVKGSEVVVVAIPPEHHHTLPPHLYANKVVVDISNRSPGDSCEVSLAERLQQYLPDSHVVKAFNTMSSYALLQGNIQGSKEVPVCGDSEAARGRVSRLVRELGLTVEDRGCLANARAVEDIPLAFFTEWRVPGIVALTLFCFWFIYMLFLNQLCPNIDSVRRNATGWEWDWTPFKTLLPLQNFQFSMAYTAASLLLATYIPGTMAGYIQLYRGTKYSWFPGWLDAWMKGRKQLGLLALFIGSTHGCCAIFTQMGWGIYMPETWDQQLHFTFAGLLEASLVVLGITSLPSVAARLTWREFTILQRYLGWASVVFLTGHATFSYFKTVYTSNFSCVVLPLGTQLIVALCGLTILLKLPLLLPCVDSHLMKIRRGYERGNRKTSPA